MSNKPKIWIFAFVFLVLAMNVHSVSDFIIESNQGEII